MVAPAGSPFLTAPRVEGGQARLVPSVREPCDARLGLRMLMHLETYRRGFGTVEPAGIPPSAGLPCGVAFDHREIPTT